MSGAEQLALPVALAATFALAWAWVGRTPSQVEEEDRRPKEAPASPRRDAPDWRWPPVPERGDTRREQTPLDKEARTW